MIFQIQNRNNLFKIEIAKSQCESESLEKGSWGRLNEASLQMHSTPVLSVAAHSSFEVTDVSLCL